MATLRAALDVVHRRSDGCSSVRSRALRRSFDEVRLPPQTGRERHLVGPPVEQQRRELIGEELIALLCGGLALAVGPSRRFEVVPRDASA